MKELNLPSLPAGFEHVHIVGVDPGTTTGYAFTTGVRLRKPGLNPKWRAPWTPAFQEAGEWANVAQMRSWFADWAEWWARWDTPLLVGTEAFVAGVNQRHGKGQKSLRDPLAVIHALDEILTGMLNRGREVYNVRRTARTVKRWGTNARLEAAWPWSLADPSSVKGSHARDALRHNLYAAVRAGYARDPFVPES